MKRWILRLKVATLAFAVGVVVHQVFISPKAVEAPKPQLAERCDPSRIEVKTVFVPPAAPPPVQIFDFKIDAAPLAGTYYLAKTPDAFKDFEFLNLSWWDPNENGDIQGDSTISAKANNLWDNQRTLVSVITRRRVLLITESESGDGFGYRFDGEFVQHKNLKALANDGKPILRGTLIKTKDGEKVAESFVSFWLEQHGYC